MIDVPNVIGNGITYSQILGGENSINSPPVNVVNSAPGSMLLGFYTPSALYIDSITIQSSNPPKIDVAFEVNKKGGLLNFTLKLPRDINIKFFNQMFVQFFINQNHWYTGIIDYNPVNDSNEMEITLQGNGFVKQLDKQIINTTYTNKTIQYIINDIFLNRIYGQTDIYYNIIFNNPPDTTLAFYEANDKSVKSILDDLLSYCNISYLSVEYTYYIDKDRFFHFEIIDKNSIQKNFFEGIDYQNPKVSINSDKIVNSINLYITNLNSQQVVFDSNISDIDSIANYGLRQEKLTLPGNMDAASGEGIANYRINRWGNPRKTISIDKLKTESSPFIFGTYNITNKQQQYDFVVDECNDISKWVLNFITSTLVLETQNVNSGRNSFKWTKGVDYSEYIEFTIPDPILFWETVTVWVKPTSLNTQYCVQCIDMNGNFPAGNDFAYLITEDGRRLITEDNRHLITEYTLIKTFVNQQKNVFQPLIVTNVGNLKSVKKIRIYNYNINSVCYIDRIEVGGRLFSTSTLTLESIKYRTVSSVILATAQFGEIEEDATDKIKSISDNQADIFNIFSKH